MRLQWYFTLLNTEAFEHLQSAMFEAPAQMTPRSSSTRKLCALGLALSLRLPRSSSHGDHPGTPPAGNYNMRHSFGQLPQCGLRSRSKKRRTPRGGQPANRGQSVVDQIREPIVKCFVMVPNGNIGGHDATRDLGQTRHRRHTESGLAACDDHSHSSMNEILRGLLQTKSRPSHAAMVRCDYEQAGYREDDLVKLELLVN